MIEPHNLLCQNHDNVSECRFDFRLLNVQRGKGRGDSYLQVHELFIEDIVGRSVIGPIKQSTTAVIESSK
jgi:hypothetical protein